MLNVWMKKELYLEIRYNADAGASESDRASLVHWLDSKMAIPTAWIVGKTMETVCDITGDMARCVNLLVPYK